MPRNKKNIKADLKKAEEAIRDAEAHPGDWRDRYPTGDTSRGRAEMGRSVDGVHRGRAHRTEGPFPKEDLRAYRRSPYTGEFYEVGGSDAQEALPPSQRNTAASKAKRRGKKPKKKKS